MRACEPKKTSQSGDAIRHILFILSHAITAYIISVGASLSHSAPAPPSLRLISPRFIFSTCKMLPSEECSREYHPFSSEGVHSHLAFSAFRSVVRLHSH